MAVIVQVPGVAGALKRPPVEIDPHEALQVTAWLAEKVSELSACKPPEEGEMVMGECTVTAVVADLPVPSVALAVTVHEPGDRGAVNTPAEEMDPQEAVYAAALLALNCCVAPSVTVGPWGEIVNAVDCAGAVIVA